MMPTQAFSSRWSCWSRRPRAHPSLFPGECETISSNSSSAMSENSGAGIVWSRIVMENNDDS